MKPFALLVTFILSSVGEATKLCALSQRCNRKILRLGNIPPTRILSPGEPRLQAPIDSLNSSDHITDDIFGDTREKVAKIREDFEKKLRKMEIETMKMEEDAETFLMFMILVVFIIELMFTAERIYINIYLSFHNLWPLLAE